MKDLERIDATGLPSLERHHLRLLAHCLACFKEIADGSTNGPLPLEPQRKAWLMDQSSFAEEIDFIASLLEQFAIAAVQLEELAEANRVSPLALTLEDLILESNRVHMRSNSSAGS